MNNASYQATLEMDENGNKIVRIMVPWEKSFSIKTEQNLPVTHKTNIIRHNEIIQHVQAYGTRYQKDVLNI